MSHRDILKVAVLLMAGCGEHRISATYSTLFMHIEVHSHFRHVAESSTTAKIEANEPGEKDHERDYGYAGQLYR